ncbi:MAG: RNA polymerase sigma factor [Planctomycetota bacterium]
MSNTECLVQGLQQGDEQSFTTLVNRYKTYVYSVAYNRVSNFTDAEEIAQMVFVEVFKNIRSLNEPSKLAQWLYGITDRVSLNWLRKYRKKTVSLNELGNEIAGAESNNPMEILTGQEETSQGVKKAMAVYNSLEPDHRVVLNLKYMEELSYDEIADRLGITKDAVRGKLYRAHLCLRQIKENVR